MVRSSWLEAEILGPQILSFDDEDDDDGDDGEGDDDGGDEDWDGDDDPW